jgi:hypothetical protein
VPGSAQAERIEGIVTQILNLHGAVTIWRLRRQSLQGF